MPTHISYQQGSSASSANVIDVEGGDMVIMKLEPEDIIESPNKAATSTTAANKHTISQSLDRSKHDTVPASTATTRRNSNPTLMKHIDISPLDPGSFQQSRTPFKKRLEMLRQGVCQPKAYNIPQVITPLTYLRGGANAIPLHLTNGNADIASKLGSGISSVLDIKPEPMQDKDNYEILDTSKYVGKRLYIDEESKSDCGAKRKCVDDKATRSANFSPTMPTGPIPTILTQLSEEEKVAQPPMKKGSTAKRRRKNTKRKM